MTLTVSLPQSQQPAIYPHPKSDQSSQLPTHLRSTLILSSHLYLRLVNGLSPQVSLPTLLLSAIRVRCPPPPSTQTSLFDHSKKYLVKSTDHKAPRYVVFSTLLLLRPSCAQIPSSTTYFRTPSAYFSHSKWQTKFHTHIKQRAKLWFRIF
jgi:hypothetical protein